MEYNESNIVFSDNTNNLEVDRQSFIHPDLSANSLFHFMGNFNNLLDDIKFGALPPLFCKEDVGYLSLALKTIAYPMICFCDINLHKINHHVEYYGPYGIAFEKSWGMNKGIQPIQYVCENSILAKDFSEAFDYAYNNPSNIPSSDYLQTHMYYLKPIYGSMEKDGIITPKNFCDECEWRYIPDFSQQKIPKALREHELYSKSFWNELILNNKDLWLSFDYSDIKYIIVNSRSEIDAVWEMLKSLDISDTIKVSTISKLLVWNEIKEDV